MMLHAVFLPLVRDQPEVAPNDDSTNIVIERLPPVHRPISTPHPSPTPRPKSTSTPAPRPPARHSTPPVRAPHRSPNRPLHLAHRAVTSQPIRGVSIGSTSGTPTGDGITSNDASAGAPLSPPGDAAASAVPATTAALPPATAPPACAQPNRPAITLDPIAPETPPLAAEQGISGQVTVVISLDTANRVVGARVRSSPSALLNSAAVAAARASRFQTEIRDCLPVAADYEFVVEFAAQ